MSKHHVALGLEPNCGSIAVKAKWRELAAIHHPDRGGMPSEFAEIRHSYQKAMAYEMSIEATCKTCDGVGTVTHTQGFYTTRRRCPDCK